MQVICSGGCPDGRTVNLHPEGAEAGRFIAEREDRQYRCRLRRDRTPEGIAEASSFVGSPVRRHEHTRAILPPAAGRGVHVQPGRGNPSARGPDPGPILTVILPFFQPALDHRRGGSVPPVDPPGATPAVWGAQPEAMAALDAAPAWAWRAG